MNEFEYFRFSETSSEYVVHGAVHDIEHKVSLRNIKDVIT